MDKVRTYYKQTRVEMIPLLPYKYHKVLEIGCGIGMFKNNLINKCEYWGVEPAKDPARFAEEKLDRVLVGTYDEVYNELPDNYFDLVICNDVIEHMVDHNDFFQSIKNKMTNDGCLVASIPNVRYLENLLNLIIAKDWHYTDSGVLDKTHLRFFTEKSLKDTIVKNGYTIEKFSYLNSIFTNPYTIGAIIKKVLVTLLGKDTEFIQFGIRIKKRCK